MSEYSEQLSFNPKEDLGRLEKTLIKIKLENESVTVDTFQELYNLIHKTNLEIRYRLLQLNRGRRVTEGTCRCPL